MAELCCQQLLTISAQCRGINFTKNRKMKFGSSGENMELSVNIGKLKLSE